MKQQLMMLLLGTASVFCSCRDPAGTACEERVACSGLSAGEHRPVYQCMVFHGQLIRRFGQTLER